MAKEFRLCFKGTFWCSVLPGAYEQEHATPLYFCHGVFIDRFIFRSNLLWMRLPWECHSQSQDTNWRHCVIGPELRFFHKRKGVLKIDRSVKMPWHRLSMGVASSCSSAPGLTFVLHRGHIFASIEKFGWHLWNVANETPVVYTDLFISLLHSCKWRRDKPKSRNCWSNQNYCRTIQSR